MSVERVKVLNAHNLATIFNQVPGASPLSLWREVRVRRTETRRDNVLGVKRQRVRPQSALEEFQCSALHGARIPEEAERSKNCMQNI